MSIYRKREELNGGPYETTTNRKAFRTYQGAK